VTVVITLTKPNSDTDFNAVYVIGSGACGGSINGCTKTTDICGSGSFPKISLIANTNYYLAILKRHDDTSAGVDFDLKIYEYTAVNTEDFDSPVGSLPPGWLTEEGSGSLGWRVGTASQLSSGDYVVPDGGFGQMVGIVAEDGCSNGVPGMRC
jgi:hypothetical protein